MKIVLLALLVACKAGETRPNKAIEFVRLASPHAKCEHKSYGGAVTPDVAVCAVPQQVVTLECSAGGLESAKCVQVNPPTPPAAPTPEVTPVDAGTHD